MKCKVSNDKDAVILDVDGEVDMGTTPELRTTLLSELSKQPKRVVIDFKGVTFIDSSGIATLVEALKESNRVKAQLFFCNVSGKIMSVFELTRLDKVFKIVDTRERALQ